MQVTVWKERCDLNEIWTRLCEVIVQSILLAVEEARVFRSGSLSSGSPLYFPGNLLCILRKTSKIFRSIKYKKECYLQSESEYSNGVNNER